MIDINCDLGEGAGQDAELLGLCTSANVCCGAHAGDEASIRATLQLAEQAGVCVGAHPGYPDREHFGRREMALGAAAIVDLIVSQVVALRRWAGDGTIRFLKPHGALYNQACRDPDIAEPVVRAAETLGLPLVGLPESALETAATGRVGFRREGFADRAYRPDGSLVSRAEPGAMIEDPAAAADQVERLLRERAIDTICVHGDGPHAVEFLTRLRAELLSRGHHFGAIR